MGDWEEAMTELRLVLSLLLGLCLGVAVLSADSWAASGGKKKVATVRGKQCQYKCPKGTFVCIEDNEPGPNGCYFYTCSKGKPGSESCP